MNSRYSSSSTREVRKSFRINVLFSSDLAFTSPILAGAGGSTVLAVRGATHRGRRLRRFTPRQQGRGEQGPRGWNTSSGQTTGTSQASTGSSECREIKRRVTAPYSVQEAVEVLSKQAFSLTSRCVYPGGGGTYAREVELGRGRGELGSPIGAGAKFSRLAVSFISKTNTCASQVWFQNRRARSIKTGRLPKSSKSVLGGRGVVDPPPGPVTSAFLTSTTLADMFRPEQSHSCEDVPQMYSDWIQIYSNPVSSPPASSSLHQQPTLGSSKPPESHHWEEEHHQRQHLGPARPGFLPGSFTQPVSRQPQHSASTRSYQAFRNFKPQTMAPSGAHQAVYGGGAAGGGHTSVDQVVPSHPQPVYWEVTQGQGHHHHHHPHHHHHLQMGPQTSMGYISDLIYNAAIVTNFLEF